MHRQARHPWRWALLLALCTIRARADGEWACKATLSGHNFDFSSLGGERVVKRERETPPTKMIDTLTFDLCNPLSESKDGAEADRARPSVLCLLLFQFSTDHTCAAFIVSVWDVCLLEDSQSA